MVERGGGWCAGRRNVGAAPVRAAAWRAPLSAGLGPKQTKHPTSYYS